MQVRRLVDQISGVCVYVCVCVCVYVRAHAREFVCVQYVCGRVGTGMSRLARALTICACQCVHVRSCVSACVCLYVVHNVSAYIYIYKTKTRRNLFTALMPLENDQ